MINRKHLKINSTFILKVCLLSLLSICFLMVKPIFTYDGVWYLGYMDYLDGTLPFNEWNNIRGFVYPIILYFGYLLNIQNGIGINSVFLLFYLIMFYYILKIIDLYRKDIWKNTKYIWIDYIIATFTIALNPYIWGYYHIVLTESISFTFLVVFFYYSLVWGMQRLQGEDNIGKYVMYSLFSAVMLILAYFLKQSYFGIVIFILIGMEILFIIVKKEKKQIIYCVCLWTFLAVTMVGTVKIWNANTTKDETSYIASQVSRLRYFLKENNWLYDQKQTVSIIDDNEEVIEQFEYEFGQGIIDGVEYILFCIFQNPERVISGWIDNYLTLCGIYQVPVNEQYDLSAGQVLKDDIYTNIFGINEKGSISVENKTLASGAVMYGVDMEKRARDIKESMSKWGTYYSEKINNFQYYTGGNTIAKCINNPVSLWLTCVSYTLFLLLTPIYLIYIIIRMIKKKNIEEDLGEFIAVCFGTLYLMMMAMLGQIIDRYVMQVYVINLVVFIILIGKVLSCYTKNTN